ncbi:hypothetical protein A3J41_03260 [candidate division TM6 bacterium RIFCSPHIGHO2_12_FULL_38_8]|nr:MAG: hypothetical protein A3J41_03260 [candidate division TM6 bacterium RIFCSPHIGHO2_12_FULL_38_8]
MKQNKKMIIQFLVLMLFSLPLQAVNIALLKGTTGIAPEGYDPVWGLSMWELGIAKQLYNLSAQQMMKKTETSLQNPVTQTPLTPEQQANKTNVVQILSEQKNTATEDLIEQMFHESGGSFKVTSADNNFVRQLTPEHIGNILKIVSENQSDFKQMKSELSKYLNPLNFTRKSGNTLVKVETKYKTRFIKTLVDAVQECSVANADRIYPENTAQNIILGYLLAKSNTRQDLQDYLSAVTGKQVALSDEQYNAQDFKKTLNEAPDLTNVQSFSDFMCASVYQENYVSSFLPKIVVHDNVAYQTTSFSDCVETTIRNLCNIATYSAQDQKLGQTPKDVAMSADLQNFYSQSLHQNPAEVSNKAVHQTWTNLVENKPGMLYGNLLDPDSHSAIRVLDQCDGVMPVASIDATLPSRTVTIGSKNYQVQEKQVGGKTYWLVPNGSPLHCYELTTTASNIIVALNDLFNLNLYQSTDDVLQPDFAQKHFESMCAKFDWTVSQNEMQKVINLEQGKSSNVEIAVNTAEGANFKINLTTKVHSFISVNPTKNQSLQMVDKGVTSADGKTQAACAALGAVDDKDLLSLQSGSVFYKSIANPDERMNLIKSLMKDQTNIDQNESYVTRLIMSMGDLSDPHYQDSVLESIKDLQIVSQPIAQALVVMTSVAAAKYNYPEANVKYCQILQKGILEENDLQQLVELMMTNRSFSSPSIILSGLKEQGFMTTDNKSLMLQLMNQVMDGYDQEKQRQCLEILHSLVKIQVLDDSDMTDTLLWIHQVMNHNDAFLQNTALNILDSVIKQGLIESDNVDWVLRIIQPSIKFSDEDMQEKIFRIFGDLIDKNLLSDVQAESLWQALSKITVYDSNSATEVEDLKKKLSEYEAKPTENLESKSDFVQSKTPLLPEPESDNQSIVKQRQQQEQQRLLQDQLRQAELNRDQHVDPTDQPDVVR